MGYRAYPEYKESGVEWLGKCPAHWDVIAIKQHTPVRRGASPRPIQDPKYFDDEGEYSWVRIADVTANNHYLEETTQRLSALGKSLSVPLEPGSLFLSIAGSVGKPMITNIKCCIHDGFVYFPYYQHDTEFMYYIFECGQAFLGLGKLGTQLNLNTDTVGSIKIGLPPIEEQQKIASFLDCKTAQIDHLIEKKQELIEKLQEQRIAITTQAITKGLDSNAAMKDSGIEWLGSVPEHWDVHQLSLLTETIQTGPFGSQLHAADYVEGGVPLINPAHLVSGDIIPDEQSAVDAQTVGRLNRHKLKPADIIMARRGEIGRCAFVEEEQAGWLCGTGSLIIRFAKGNSRFFSIVISSGGFSKNLELYAVGSTMLNLNPTIVGRMPVPVPPRAEQDQIVSYIYSATKKIDRSITKARETIERLQEYRAALITAAVTGQIDVRDWQAPKSTKESAANKEVA